MNAAQITAMVSAILIEQLGCLEEQVTPEARLADLGADSIDHVELMMAFEEEFGIQITDEDSERLLTVKQVQDFILANATE